MKEQIEGKAKQIKGEVREKFGRMTNDTSETIGGAKDKAVGKAKEAFGQKKSELNKKIDRMDDDH